jgi:DNA-directed RNA polymerase specialized sigma subunit
MIKSLPGERWRQVIFKNWTKLQKKYAVSNKGRVASYTNDLKKDGNLINGSTVEDYKIMRFKVKDKYLAFLFHRLVAEYFLKQLSPEHDFVIHLNHDKADNRKENLRWATKEQVIEHNKNNPRVIAAKENLIQHAGQYASFRKLNLQQVITIKKLLANPFRKLTYKQIAEKYGISEMAITRMKRGENWGYIKI